MKVKITYRAWDNNIHTVTLHEAVKRKLADNKFVINGYISKSHTNARSIHSESINSYVEFHN